jgi:hypothetical protein
MRASHFLVFDIIGQNIDLFGGVDGVYFFFKHQLILDVKLFFLNDFLVLKLQLTLF